MDTMLDPRMLWKQVLGIPFLLVSPRHKEVAPLLLPEAYPAYAYLDAIDRKTGIQRKGVSCVASSLWPVIMQETFNLSMSYGAGKHPRQRFIFKRFVDHAAVLEEKIACYDLLGVQNVANAPVVAEAFMSTLFHDTTTDAFPGVKKDVVLRDTVMPLLRATFLAPSPGAWDMEESPLCGGCGKDLAAESDGDDEGCNTGNAVKLRGSLRWTEDACMGCGTVLCSQCRGHCKPCDGGWPVLAMRLDLLLCTTYVRSEAKKVYTKLVPLEQLASLGLRPFLCLGCMVKEILWFHLEKAGSEPCGSILGEEVLGRQEAGRRGVERLCRTLLGQEDGAGVAEGSGPGGGGCDYGPMCRLLLQPFCLKCHRSASHVPGHSVEVRFIACLGDDEQRGCNFGHVLCEPCARECVPLEESARLDANGWVHARCSIEASTAASSPVCIDVRLEEMKGSQYLSGGGGAQPDDSDMTAVNFASQQVCVRHTKL